MSVGYLQNSRGDYGYEGMPPSPGPVQPLTPGTPRGSRSQALQRLRNNNGGSNNGNARATSRPGELLLLVAAGADAPALACLRPPFPSIQLDVSLVYFLFF